MGADSKLISQEDKVDAILLAPVFNRESTAFLNHCRQQQWPYVFINSDIPDEESLCYIGPELQQSGYLAGHLMHFALAEQDKVLILNISCEMDAHHYLLRKEEGFRKYFSDESVQHQLIKKDIHQTDYPSVQNQLEQIFRNDPDIGAIFTTNSRVSTVARFLEGCGKENLLLIGYDFLADNLEYLKRKTIDFLICQKPEEQGYRGVMALYQHMVVAAPVEKTYFMPIDIITRENYRYYSN